MVKVVAVLLGFICAVCALPENDPAVSSKLTPLSLTTEFEPEGRKC